MKPIIVGQAPSRKGDGAPFSGPSGARLCRLVGVKDPEELKDYFKLINLIKHQLDPHPRGRGDKFDLNEAKKRATRILSEAEPEQVFIACGRQVWKCLTGTPDGEFYTRRVVTVTHNKKPSVDVNVYLFPHPSGASSIWNYPAEVRRAQTFLRLMAEGLGA